MMNNLNHKGITRADIAMALVIIGLMVGAVIKGQAMIYDAKHKRLMNDLQGISAAYFTYYDEYNSLPGDDTNNYGWSGVDEARGNSAGNGYIDGNNAVNGDEAHEAWQAMRYARLLSGDPEATGNAHLPITPFNGKYYLGHHDFGSAIGTKNHIEVTNISGDVAESVDIMLDDGVYNTGTIQASPDYTSRLVDMYYAL
jgi:hypothetical protein